MKYSRKINPFDILSGKVVRNEHGTFYFKEAGLNTQENGFPILGNLHRTNGPAAIYNGGVKDWWVNGRFLKTEDDLLSLILYKGDK